MSKDHADDRVIKDGSGSTICFVRDMAYINNKLNVTKKTAGQILLGVSCIIIAIFLQSSHSDYIFLEFIAGVLIMILLDGAVIAGINIRNSLVVRRMCTMFTVYNDRLDIDGNVFEISKIKSAFMTPFEYYEKRFVIFEYNNKKYRYYFGKFNGIGKAEFYYKPYAQLNMLLESRGFSNKY